MAQNNNPRLANNTSVPPEAVVALASANTGTANPMMEQLLALMAKKMAREEQEIAEKEETERNARLMNARALQEQRDKELATQAICSHLTEKGDRASISGQRGHNGKYILLCARCSKLWTDVSEIPPHLNNLIRWDWIGGPQ